MAMKMRNMSRANSRAVVRRTASRQLAVTVNAHQSRSPRDLTAKVAPAVLAALVSLTSGFTPLDILMPSPVHAEEQEDEALTPYERRQKDLARRRELLKEAREKALLKASGVQETTTTLGIDAKVESSSAEQPAAEEAKEPEEVKPTSVFQQRKPTPPPVAAPVAPPPAPVEETKPAFSFSAPKPAPPPAVVAPPPAPAPVVVVPQKVAASAVTPTPPSKPSPAPEQKTASKKRRGPLPTFLAELLVLGFYAGFFTAITKYNSEVGAAVNTAKAAVVSLYEKVEKAVPADFK